MQGPIAARRFSRLAPSRSMAAIVLSTTPPAPSTRRPAPPTVAGVGIGQQHRRAIGGQHAQHDARPVGDQRIRLGRAGRGPALLGDGQHVGRMDLVHGQEFCIGEIERGRGAAADLAQVGLIARAVAAVERRIETGAHAAAAREEAMLHAVELGKRFGLDHVVSEGVPGWVSVKPAGAALLPSPTAMTRNRVPI